MSPQKDGEEHHRRLEEIQRAMTDVSVGATGGHGVSDSRILPTLLEPPRRQQQHQRNGNRSHHDRKHRHRRAARPTPSGSIDRTGSKERKIPTTATNTTSSNSNSNSNNDNDINTKDIINIDTRTKDSININSSSDNETLTPTAVDDSDKKQNTNVAAKMKLIVRSKYWGRTLEGRTLPNHNHVKVLSAQAFIHKTGPYWGCCPQQGSRVLELTNEHFLEEHAGAWELHRLADQTFWLAPSGGMHTTPLGIVMAESALEDLGTLLGPYFQILQHVHVQIVMQRATDKEMTRKSKASKEAESRDTDATSTSTESRSVQSVRWQPPPPNAYVGWSHLGYLTQPPQPPPPPPQRFAAFQQAQYHPMYAHPQCIWVDDMNLYPYMGNWDGQHHPYNGHYMSG